MSKKGGKKVSITVGVLEGRGLGPTNFFGTADTYCVVTVFAAEGEEHKDQTGVQTGTLEPSWAHTASFPSVGKASKLIVSVRNSETHEALGAVTLDKSKLRLKDGTPPKPQQEDWHTLLAEEGMVAAAAGEIKLSLLVGPAGKESKADKAAAKKAAKAAKGAPNLLRVQIVQGRGLRANDTNFLGADTSDPFVELRCGGQQHKTATKHKTCDPVWDEHCEFSATDPEDEISILVYDEDLMSQTLLGQLKIPLADVLQTGPGAPPAERAWLKLLGDKMDEGEHGEVEVSLTWTHDEAHGRAIKAAGGAASAAAAMGGAGGQAAGRMQLAGSSAGDFEARRAKAQRSTKRKTKVKAAGGDGGDGGKKKGGMFSRLRKGGNNRAKVIPRKGLSEEERKAAQAEAKAEIEKLRTMEAQLVSGDYQVQVHVIECRNLKGEDLNGSCDPVVQVEVLGERQSTSIKEQMRDPVFDEVLFFNLKNVDKEQLRDGMVSVACYDADTIGRNDMVGSHSFDLMGIYLHDDHELYRSWVALVDLEEKDDSGAQGYMKLSITVLGPGDTQAVHDLAAERKEEKEAESAGGEDGMAAMCLMPPTLKLELEFLVVTVYIAEDLPAMDTGLMGTGTDAFIQVDFGGNPPCKTSVVTEKGALVHPFFEEELWIPVMVPTMSSAVVISVWDEDTVTDDVIGFVSGFSFKQARAAPIEPRWANLYGAPHDINSGEAAERMNRYPNAASHYRGRVLIGARTVPSHDQPGRAQQLYTEAREKDMTAADLPPVARYTLRAFLMRGAELPTFTVGSNQVSVKVSIGGHVLHFDARANKGVGVEWGDLKSAVSMELPADVEQLPDIFIYLCTANLTGDGVSDIAYARLKAADVIRGKFKTPAAWTVLKADPAVGKISEGTFPGALLMKLGFGPDSAAEKVSWDAEVGACDEMVPFRLRVNVYQARGLPALDDEGTLDPYVVAHCAGKTQQTRTRKQSCYPLWYQTLEFDVMLPETLAHAPQVTLECWDWDQFTPDEMAGVMRLPMTQAVICEQPDTPAPRPKWLPLGAPGDMHDALAAAASGADAPLGEMLISMQLVRKRDLGDEMPDAPAITPELKAATIEIVAVGLRDLESFGFSAIQMPWLEFDLGGGAEPVLEEVAEGEDGAGDSGAAAAVAADGSASPGITALHHHTEASRKPSGNNPNFLEHTEFECELPVDPLFTPQLALKVFDTRLGGYQTPLIATGCINLDTKVPWNKAAYVPPQQQALVVRSKEPRADRGGDLEEEDESKEGKKDKKKKKKDKKKKTGGGSDDGDAQVSGSPWVEQTFLQGRDWWVKTGAKELEEYLRDAPFETYELFRGQGDAGLLSLGRRCVGKLKGVVRVLERKARDPSKKEKKEKQLFDMARLQHPKPYRVRVYATMGFSLQPMDYGGLSDPYLKVRLGEHEIDDCSSYISDTLDPEFYKLFELNAELPGASQLELEVWDHDDFTPDEMIGKTVIDLEDRLFHKGWGKLGKDHEKAGKEGPLKPLETRALWSNGSSNPQGRLQLWVELLSPEEAKSIPPLTGFAPPTPEEFEVQIVCWKSQDVLAMDAGNMNDLCTLPCADNCRPTTAPPLTPNNPNPTACVTSFAFLRWRVLHGGLRAAGDRHALALLRGRRQLELAPQVPSHAAHEAGNGATAHSAVGP